MLTTKLLPEKKKNKTKQEPIILHEKKAKINKQTTEK